MQSNSLMDKLKQVEQLSDKEKSFLQETDGTQRARREIPPTLDGGVAKKVPAKGKGKSRAVSGGQPAAKPRGKPTAPKASGEIPMNQLSTVFAAISVPGMKNQPLNQKM